MVPNEIDILFLKKFKEIIEKYIKKGFKLIIITGGGKTARKYQEAAKKILGCELHANKKHESHTNKLHELYANEDEFDANKNLSRDARSFNEDLDWLGIHSTRLNAHLLLTIFRKYAYYRVIKDPRKKNKEFIGELRILANLNEPSRKSRSISSLQSPSILIAAGWKPGFSTDYDAVLLAKGHKIDTVINLTNVDYVYNKDPNKFKDTKPIKEITWKDYLKLIQQKWIPGLSAPFDPVASKLAYKLKINCVILNGRKLKNFENYLESKKFIGTIIYSD